MYDFINKLPQEDGCKYWPAEAYRKIVVTKIDCFRPSHSNKPEAWKQVTFSLTACIAVAEGENGNIQPLSYEQVKQIKQQTGTSYKHYLEINMSAEATCWDAGFVQDELDNLNGADTFDEESDLSLFSVATAKAIVAMAKQVQTDVANGTAFANDYGFCQGYYILLNLNITEDEAVVVPFGIAVSTKSKKELKPLTCYALGFYGCVLKQVGGAGNGYSRFVKPKFKGMSAGAGKPKFKGMSETKPRVTEPKPRVTEPKPQLPKVNTKGYGDGIEAGDPF